MKKWARRTPVCIVFPNSYYLGMSNLAIHILYRTLNGMADVVCERAFFHENGQALSVESNRPLSSFEILFFSLSFELDYINIPRMLKKASIPVRAADRAGREPLVVAGGICMMANPEPVSSLFDLIVLGDVEATVLPFMEKYLALRGKTRETVIGELGRFDHVYNPRQLSVTYGDEGKITGFIPPDFTVKVARHHGPGLGSSAIMTRATEFSDMYLTEGTRGCPSRCPFCLLGNVYPFRHEGLGECPEGITDLGIVGGGVSFHPGLLAAVKEMEGKGIHVHLPSLRIDKTPVELFHLIRKEVKTLTFGVEAATERLRAFIGKPISDAEILEKIGAIMEKRPFHLKLYFMIGLFGETEDDIGQIPSLAKKIKHVMIRAGARRGQVGSITVHVSPFVPKPFTPFQWLPMDDMDLLKAKISRLRRAFGRVDNTFFTHESVKHSYLQGILSRGDRRLHEVLLRLSEGETLAKVMRESPINLAFYAARRMGPEEVLPWDFIEGFHDKGFLHRRLVSALTHLGRDPGLQ